MERLQLVTHLQNRSNYLTLYDMESLNYYLYLTNYYIYSCTKYAFIFKLSSRKG